MGLVFIVQMSCQLDRVYEKDNALITSESKNENDTVNSSDIYKSNSQLQDSSKVTLKKKGTHTFERIIEGDPSAKSNRITLSITHGFEKEQMFKFYLNDSLIKESVWKSNYFVDKTSQDEIFHNNLELFLSTDIFLANNMLKVEIEEEFIEFPITLEEAKTFDYININRAGEIWKVNFQKIDLKKMIIIE